MLRDRDAAALAAASLRIFELASFSLLFQTTGL